MAWTLTEIATGLTDESTHELGAEYDGISLHFTTIAAYLGYFGGTGTRKIYYNLGHLTPSRGAGLTWGPVRLRYQDQIVIPQSHTVNRAFVYLPVGCVATLNGLTWT